MRVIRFKMQVVRRYGRQPIPRLRPCPLPTAHCPLSPRREIGVGFDAGDERGEQVGGLVEVLERDHLDRAVHVAIGDAHQPGGDAGAGELDGVGVGPGAAAEAAI